MKKVVAVAACAAVLVAVAPGVTAYRGSILFDTFMSDDPATDPCYDEVLKKSIACIPDFVNAAFGLPVQASSTSGQTPNQFCHGAYYLLAHHPIFADWLLMS